MADVTASAIRFLPSRITVKKASVLPAAGSRRLPRQRARWRGNDKTDFVAAPLHRGAFLRDVEDAVPYGGIIRFSS